DVTGQVVVTDLAGNAATFTTVPRNIDKTAPVVSIVSPSNGANFGFYQDLVAGYSCTDTSLLSCVGTTADGELVNTKTAGARTYKVTGKDLAGFTTAVTNSFTVESLFNFEGFLAPANEPPTLNLVPRGSLVPIRWRLPDGNGGFVSNTASFTSATVATLTCGSAPVTPLNETANGPSGIGFDAATGTFTYNWQTTVSWTGCRKLTIKLKDNSTHELRFKFQ
ncbi:MAG TPA: PxKF domain-containing protein, partial [Steroidobacteraceae bacterium]|nr:PxKF domain-containing protein [Steroidobacteraceae bacterium]